MADDTENDREKLGDNWLSTWELQCLDEWDRDSNMEDLDLIRSENEQTLQKLWLTFQNSASAIAQLYKEGSQNNPVSLWLPFQNSASSVTLLHRVSQDAVKRAFDLGCQHGSQRRTRDLLNWARKRRRHTRRIDLVAYLCGKTAPVRSHLYYHRPNNTMSRTPTRVGPGLDRSCSPRSSTGLSVEGSEDTEPDLQPFRDALALHSLSGAMSNISVDRGSPRSNCSAPTAGVDSNEVDNLHYFIMDEMARHCDSRKRSSSDSRMDSPSRKRGRFWSNNDNSNL